MQSSYLLICLFVCYQVCNLTCNGGNCNFRCKYAVHLGTYDAVPQIRLQAIALMTSSISLLWVVCELVAETQKFAAQKRSTQRRSAEITLERYLQVKLRGNLLADNSLGSACSNRRLHRNCIIYTISRIKLIIMPIEDTTPLTLEVFLCNKFVVRMWCRSNILL